jgi:hypothetical protein
VATDQLDPVVEVLAAQAGRGEPPCVVAPPATATRLSLTATRLGRSLTDVAFSLGGEPYPDARRQSIEAAGARGVPMYGSSEAAPVGAQCPLPAATDAVHVFTDLYAVLPDRRPLPDGRAVDGILLTGLLRAGPKILLNTDIGDGSPRVGPLVESEVVGAFFDEVASLRLAYGFMVDQWRRGGFLEVRRELPRVTARGKIPRVQTLAGPDRGDP